MQMASGRCWNEVRLPTRWTLRAKLNPILYCDLQGANNCGVEKAVASLQSGTKVSENVTLRLEKPCLVIIEPTASQQMNKAS